jgi:regulator of protease activity HflC (stomatin/prohibitin superfamily)
MERESFLEKHWLGLTFFVAVALFSLIGACSSYYTVGQSERGIVLTFSKANPAVKEPGLHFKTPFITDVVKMNIQQSTFTMEAKAYSKDQQQVTANLAILRRIPESNVYDIFCNYKGDPDASLIAPRVLEAFKEIAAQYSAIDAIQQREIIKEKTKELAIKKIGTIVTINDIVLQNIDLSDQLEKAIEEKMVQQQEASKAQFRKQQAQVDAETAEIAANGKAKAISIEAAALAKNKDVIALRIIEKWDGTSPQTVVTSGNSPANIILPITNGGK